MDFIDALYNEKGLLFRAKSVRVFHKCTAMLQRKKRYDYDVGNVVLMTEQMSYLRAIKKFRNEEGRAWVPETTRKMRNVLKCIHYVDKSILT